MTATEKNISKKISGVTQSILDVAAILIILIMVFYKDMKEADIHAGLVIFAGLLVWLVSLFFKGLANNGSFGYPGCCGQGTKIRRGKILYQCRYSSPQRPGRHGATVG
jgi:hypothetical protein